MCSFTMLMFNSEKATAVVVGDASEWLPGLLDRARALQVNGGFEPHADL
jgi:malonate-semialdehyde dehydrogenase (acetylating)/methylmalonate-semialdehyde dehydrogenase